MRVSVLEDRTLRAVTFGLKALPRTYRNAINRQMTADLGPTWKGLVQANATRPMDARMLAAGVRAKGGNPPMLLAAQSRRAIGKNRRLVPQDDWPAWEFGGYPDTRATYRRRSKNGGTHKVTRHASRHLRPRNPSGYVVYPALAEFAPRAISLWVSTFIRMVYDAAEGKA